MDTLRVTAGGSLRGTLQVPGDKSISHRAIMLGALADGITTVSGFLEGEDSLATLAAFRAMGVVIEGPNEGCLRIHGVGLQGLKAPSQTLDVGNAGTAMRLMAGLLAGQQFDSQLSGDISLSKRPMGRVVEPLQQMGAAITANAKGFPPLSIQGNQSLHAIEYLLPMPSAQVKSCLLLAGLYAKGRTQVIEPQVTRDHTERMLQAFGVPVERHENRISLQTPQQLQAQDLHIPADISSAAFFMVAASIAPNSDILLSNVGINPSRTGVIDILRVMGADLTLQNVRQFGQEPVADIRVRSADLQGIDIPEKFVASAIDEFPAIFIAAACANGRTVLTGAAELRVKESDRIAVMAEGLQRLGIDATATDDGMRIEPGSFTGGDIDSHGDHRIAMAFAIAGLRAEQAITIHDCSNVATSFPNFTTLAQQAGLHIHVIGS